MSESQTVANVAPTLFLTDADVASLANWPSAVTALQEAYARPIADAMVPPRTMARGNGFWMRTLTAISPAGGNMGCKIIAASPRAKCASYLISLFDQETMELRALIDGNRVTGIRTAASAALAINLLAPKKPLQVGVVGSGFEAKNALDCLRSIRDLQSVRVFSPTPTSREKFASGFKQHLNIYAVASAEEAVRDADVIICAARSRDESPVIQGLWLPDGATVVSLGSTLPEQREVDETTLERVALIVADMPEEVLHDTGDAIAAIRAGIQVSEKLVSLAELASGQITPRRSEKDIVIYKSVGSALQDVVVAEMLLAQAKQSGLGTPLPVTISPVQK